MASNEQPQQDQHTTGGWRQFLPVGTVLALIGGVVLASYIAWDQPQRAPNRGVYERTAAQTPETTPALPPDTRFAALNPGLEAALLLDRPRVDALAISVAELPPVGVYLPRTGDRLFELPTPTPRPTIPPPTATYTPEPSITPPSDLGFITATPPAFYDPLGNPGPTVVARAEEDDECAPSGLPTAGVLTQRFHRWHIGIDLGVHVGTGIVATHSGEVIFAGWSEIGYGYLVIVQSGKFITYYAHLSALNVVVGQQVGRGTILAWSGNTGNSSGPHLHYEIRINDVPVDPLTFEERGYHSC